MEDISGKFREWLLEKDKWGLYKRRAEMCPDTLEVGFYHGYTIAQKEMQNALENKDREMVQVKHLYKHLEEKLDAAIEVIKYYASRDNWNPWHQGLEVLIDGEDAEGIKLNDKESFDLGGKRARDFLKAMGE